MASEPVEQVTQILAAVQDGDARATERLLPLLYDELRALARRKMANEPSDHTLQATALVHEAYLRLVQDKDARWESRGHFFAAAAEAMRRILVERARRYAAAKRGGGGKRVQLDELQLTFDMPSTTVLALDEVLTELERIDPQMGKVVKLRFFSGLTVEETAAACGLSTRTVDREWAYARTWLYKRLAET
ncbi:MAG: sigma-70 family RNA polymerase sigma factor, partial [Gemmatimonadota bacterium]